MRKLALLLVNFAFVACALAGDWYWDGGVSTNWADLSNWNSASDGTGSAPSSVDDLLGNDLWLFTTGTYLPSNQNIDDLEVDELVFDSTLTSFAIDGLSIQLNNRINVATSPADNQTLTFRNDIIRNSNNTWNNGGKVTLVMEGAVGETGGSRKHDASGNTVEFHGPVTLSGGFQNRTSRASFFGMDTTGVFPTSVDPDYFWSSWGSFMFSLPSDDVEGYEYEFDSNVGLYTENVLQCYVEDWVSVIFDGVLTPIDQNRRFYKASNGRVCLNGDNTFTGTVECGGGILRLGGTLADTVVIKPGGGSLDLFGRDIGGSYYFSGSYGYLSSGSIRNSDMTSVSHLTGDITQLVAAQWAENSIQFGGVGDIVLTGDITDSKDVYQLAKTGSGCLTIAGASSFGGEIWVKGGSMIFDYSTDNSEKISDTKEVELNGNLTIDGNESSNTEETVGDIRVGYLSGNKNAVNIAVEGNGGNSAVLYFDDLVYHSSSSVDFAPNDNGEIKTLSADNNANVNVIGMEVTYKGSTFAKVGSVADGNGYYTIEGMLDADYATAFDAGTRFECVDVVDEMTQSTLWETVAALRFNSAFDSTLTLDQSIRILGQSSADWNYTGAILVTPDVGDHASVIEGPKSINDHGQPGILSVHQFNTGAPLQINCGIVPNSTYSGRVLIKNGPGELILTNSVNGFDGLMIYEGTLTVTSIDDAEVLSAAGSGRSDTVISSATLKYIGDGDSTDRDFIIRGNAVIDASGSGKLTLDAATPVTTEDGSDHMLTLTGSGEGEVAGVLDLKVGGLIKSGSGTWTLSGSNVNKFWGGADVQGGTLVVDSTLGFDVEVSTGGTLGGTGSIVNDLNIEGALSVNLDDGCLTVGGDVDLDGASLLISGDCSPDGTYTVISAKSITGTFETVEEGYIVTYNDTDIVVEQAPPMGTLLIIE